MKVFNINEMWNDKKKFANLIWFFENSDMRSFDETFKDCTSLEEAGKLADDLKREYYTDDE